LCGSLLLGSDRDGHLCLKQGYDRSVSVALSQPTELPFKVEGAGHGLSVIGSGVPTSHISTASNANAHSSHSAPGTPSHPSAPAMTSVQLARERDMAAVSPIAALNSHVAVLDHEGVTIYAPPSYAGRVSLPFSPTCLSASALPMMPCAALGGDGSAAVVSLPTSSSPEPELLSVRPCPFEAVSVCPSVHGCIGVSMEGEVSLPSLTRETGDTSTTPRVSIGGMGRPSLASIPLHPLCAVLVRGRDSYVVDPRVRGCLSPLPLSLSLPAYAACGGGADGVRVWCATATSVLSYDIRSPRECMYSVEHLMPGPPSMVSATTTTRRGDTPVSMDVVACGGLMGSAVVCVRGGQACRVAGGGGVRGMAVGVGGAGQTGTTLFTVKQKPSTTTTTTGASGASSGVDRPLAAYFQRVDLVPTTVLTKVAQEHTHDEGDGTYAPPVPPPDLTPLAPQPEPTDIPPVYRDVGDINDWLPEEAEPTTRGGKVTEREKRRRAKAERASRGVLYNDASLGSILDDRLGVGEGKEAREERERRERESGGSGGVGSRAPAPPPVQTGHSLFDMLQTASLTASQLSQPVVAKPRHTMPDVGRQAMSQPTRPQERERERERGQSQAALGSLRSISQLGGMGGMGGERDHLSTLGGMGMGIPTSSMAPVPPLAASSQVPYTSASQLPPMPHSMGMDMHSMGMGASMGDDNRSMGSGMGMGLGSQLFPDTSGSFGGGAGGSAFPTNYGAPSSSFNDPFPSFGGGGGGGGGESVYGGGGDGGYGDGPDMFGSYGQGGDSDDSGDDYV
ncbi:hypothetical protein KIPB_005352, partial [Kipferlia bialata]